MGLWDKLFGELVDVIEWTDDTSNTLAYRFPRYGNEIKNGAMLTVREGQLAILVNEGEAADVFSPGLYKLETANMPILSTLQGWKHGFESPFKAEVYFFNTRVFTDMKWGLRNPLMMRDPEFGVVRLRAFGSYAFRVTDPKVLLTEIVGTDGHFVLEEIDQQLKNLIVTAFARVVTESGVPVLDLAASYDDLGRFLKEQINPVFGQYGLQLQTMLVENISLPEAVEKALDERASSIAVGDLDRFTRYQGAQAMRDAAQNPAGMASAGVGMGMGFAMAQSFGQAMANGNGASKETAQKDAAPDPLQQPPDIRHYHLVLNNEKHGPVNLQQIAEMIDRGEVNENTLVWTRGLAEWQSAETFREIASLLNNQPPDIPS